MVTTVDTSYCLHDGEYNFKYYINHAFVEKCQLGTIRTKYAIGALGATQTTNHIATNVTLDLDGTKVGATL